MVINHPRDGRTVVTIGSLFRARSAIRGSWKLRDQTGSPALRQDPERQVGRDFQVVAIRRRRIKREETQNSYQPSVTVALWNAGRPGGSPTPHGHDTPGA